MNRQRITIPDGHRAVILSNKLAAETLSLCSQLRKAKGSGPDVEAAKAIAGDLMLALFDAGVPSQ